MVRGLTCVPRNGRKNKLSFVDDGVELKTRKSDLFV